MEQVMDLSEASLEYTDLLTDLVVLEPGQDMGPVHSLES